ncbi:unnamed protein product [Rotaria sordida]|uniref:Uncharacterized protein n=1 Tax=Rotaria sordida TaxID=392033 RepID=A0A814DCP0_9BILA|nr:unnamed protein product [Rotaria sordida]
MTEQQLMQSICEALEELNSKNSNSSQRTLVDYCAASLNREDAFYYTVFIELEPSYEAQKQEQIDWRTFAATIDAGVCAKNRLCQKNAFEALKKSQRARGSHFEQFKVPRAIPAEAHYLLNVMMQHSIPIPLPN